MLGLNPGPWSCEVAMDPLFTIPPKVNWENYLNHQVARFGVLTTGGQIKSKDTFFTLLFISLGSKIVVVLIPICPLLHLLLFLSISKQPYVLCLMLYFFVFFLCIKTTFIYSYCKKVI